MDIRSHLVRDRQWSLYALADFEDGLFEHCDGWALNDGLVLVFRALTIRPIFVLGDPTATKALLAALPETIGYLNVQPHQLEAAEQIYRYRERHEMRRMILDNFQPRPAAVEELTAADCEEIERLYACGDGAGIAFAPFQLSTGFFRGIRKAGELLAVAGVHWVSGSEGIAAVGNIFTRPDCPGQGLAHAVTSAAIASLIEAGIQTIGLNVEHTNAAAIRVYEDLGFRARFTYFEGISDKIR